MDITLYIIGVVIAFGDPLFYSICNIIDAYYVNHSFRHFTSIIIYNSIISLLFLPVVFILDFPQFPPVSLLPIIFIVGAIECFYQFPYFYALKNADTSLVASLFSIGRIFVPVLAFFIVGEQLVWWQYLGFFLITIATFFESKKPGSFQVNKAFLFMLGTSLFFAIQTVLYKYIFESVSWGTGFVSVWIVAFMCAMSMLIYPKTISRLKKDFPVLKKNWKIFVVEELFDSMGGWCYTFATSLIPVSVVKGVSSTQSIVVLLLSIGLSKTKRFTSLIDEDAHKKIIKRKLFFYVLILTGAIIIIWR
ncbi:MAG: hypothetical protein A2233_00575 [Candidatus Kerfeldbacteria bacterium RIFOXYA2_FULL_38_24]|uniref:EamA domain-containing protein n=1 Tax=Candidatus Kerfeldbacteria bacterium RIFOXYB2_FULL_38_14 TaxID=1798547 RepID=A0A1G2BBW4_9BACT|nr:MAG: hypothetical protein A2233_00575 [Candidatus Kerfeldbacteria bacterium RIFOXYA2_FULL_38_24]OGY86654.1 MAG: hypothetical protein A2319_02865 [Candidatus Kerfeldbacteria bacterium RIFOXYB2_FULL_38_14]OGY88540.1 MAG: hypothetical protein A2458_05315 [Candidatus Kerfeldbacteria bacterium RIFOXYC2_FULL_38_9]